MQHISHLAPIVPVKDLQTSLSFYTDQLGFTNEFTWPDPPTYAVLAAGEHASLHLSQIDSKDQRERSPAILYIFVHKVDDYYQELQNKGVAIQHPIQDYEYGMREFEVWDPDGNRLTFGTSLERLE